MSSLNQYLIQKEAFINALFIDQSFDLVHLDFEIASHSASLFFVDGLVKDDILERMLEFWMQITPDQLKDQSIVQFLYNTVPYIEVSVVESKEKAITDILSGNIGLLMEGFDSIILIDARTYPTRSMQEPEDDRVLRGSHDAFVETLIFNTALIRRRIRSPQLRMQSMQIGKKSKTDIVLAYMEDQVSHDDLSTITEKLKSTQIDGLAMGQESVAECLLNKQWLNPLPRIRYTERPDCAAASIAEGSILVLTDNTPAAMILPTTFFDFLQETNDYYFPPFVGTYLRLIRLAILLLTLFLTPLWLLILQNPEWVVDWMPFILIDKPSPVPIILQLLIIEIMIDGLKLASLNTPSSLNSAFSILGAFILGDFAIKAGWFNSEVVLYMAVVAMSNYAQSSFELGYALKFFRIFLLLMVFCFNEIGFIVGILIILVILLRTKTITRHSYLYPLYPFNGKALSSLLLRKPIHHKHH